VKQTSIEIQGENNPNWKMGWSSQMGTSTGEFKPTGQKVIHIMLNTDYLGKAMENFRWMGSSSSQWSQK